MDKLRRFLNGDDNAQTPDVEEGGIDRMVTLSAGTRFRGFIICFLAGFILSIFGSIMFFFHKLAAFGAFYTLGSITSLASTMFLMGPVNQVKKMFAPTRVIATVVMILSLVLTLFFAFKTGKGGLVLLFVIIQFLAMTWYSLSYIPYARDAVKKFFEGVCT